MANTYSQIYIQVVFAVKNRNALIHHSWDEKLFQYITGIIKNKGQKVIVINGVADHIHIFIGLKPNCNLSDLVREVKKASNMFINDNKLSKYKFSWQTGFGAFSYSKSHIDAVYKYIINQKNHHKKKAFKEEYLDFLKKYEIPYEEKYLFDWFG